MKSGPMTKSGRRKSERMSSMIQKRTNVKKLKKMDKRNSLFESKSAMKNIGRNSKFFKNLRIQEKIQRDKNKKKEGFLADCKDSNGFQKLKKKYKGLRTKDDLINNKAEKIQKMMREKQKKMEEYFGKKLTKKIIEGNLTKEQKNKRKAKKKGTTMPQLFATEYISHRKLKELRAQQK